jgi:hypothetical protein
MSPSLRDGREAEVGARLPGLKYTKIEDQARDMLILNRHHLIAAAMDLNFMGGGHLSTLILLQLIAEIIV